LHAIAFYWLPETVEFFGGFPLPLALLVFALFCLTAAFQFVLCGWIFRNLGSRVQIVPLLHFPIAWFTAEAIYPRLFPWYIAHTAVHWPVFPGLAPFGGVLPVSFLVVWIGTAFCEGVFVLLGRSANRRGVVASVLCIGCALGAGHWSNEQAAKELERAPQISAGLIQGNLAAKQKGDLRYFDVNLRRYRELSEQALAQGADLLIWPESVVNRWIDESLESVAGTPLEQLLTFSVPILYGGLGLRERPAEDLKRLLEEHPELRMTEKFDAFRFLRFNSAFLLSQSRHC
jgi:apolipoprotein N-acyltransferase